MVPLPDASGNDPDDSLFGPRRDGSEFSIDVLKIDKTFVQDLGSGAGVAAGHVMCCCG